MNPCPACGNPTRAKYDPSSDWCVRCSRITLQEQRRLRFAPQHRQIIEYQPDLDEGGLLTA